MAEAVGFAASIAGLLGLAGQILKGCLFVKEFLGDIKNAPAEVKALFNEIEILSSAITITAELLDNSKALTTSLVTAADYEPALKQCLHAVEELVQQISHYGKKNSGERGLRWLEKMKVASEKKELSFHIARLERAKTQLQMVQQNVSLVLHHEHRKVLSYTSSLVTQIQSRNEAYMTVTEQSIRGLSNVPHKIDNLEKRFDDLRDQLMSTRLESMIKAAVSQALENHQATISTRNLSHDVKRCNSAGPEAEGISVHPFSVDGVSLHSRRRESQLLHHTSFRNLIFSIDIKTLQSSSQLRKGSNEVSFEPAQRSTVVHIQSNIPFWRRGTIINFVKNMDIPSASIAMHITPNNIVPNDAPIMEALRNLDVLEVRRLFEAGLASPHDRHYVESGDPISLMDVVIYDIGVNKYHRSLFKTNTAVETSKVKKLIEYLVRCTSNNLRNITWVNRISTSIENSAYDTEALELLVWALRLLLRNYGEDPFTKQEEEDISSVVNAENEKNPFVQVLLTQEEWQLDLNSRSHWTMPNAYIENTRLMLSDPYGHELVQALRQGQVYIPIGNFRYDGSSTLPTPRGVKLAAITLLQIYHYQQKNQNVESAPAIRDCCVRRLSILFQHGYDPQAYLIQQHGSYIASYIEYMREKIGDEYLHKFTAVRVAKHLRIVDALKEALMLAGWTASRIQDAFDEEEYIGLGELFEPVDLKSRDQCRAQFIDDLCIGKYSDMRYTEMFQLTNELHESIGISAMDVHEMLESSQSAFRERSTPGSWTEGSVFLLPGLDFSLPKLNDFPLPKPEDWEDIEEIEEWDCVRTILAEHRQGSQNPLIVR